jgi:hypothetical protein
MRACSYIAERSLSYAKINKIYRMLKLYHIKITVRQHCVNNSSKIIKNNGNNKFIVYFCSLKLRKECNLLEMSVG